MGEVMEKERKPMARHHHRGGSRGNSAATAALKNVKVIAKPGTTKPIDFELRSNLLKGSELVFNKDNDGMKKKDFYLVDFELDDQTSLNLSFQPNPMKALWVNMGDAMGPPRCPDTAAYCDDIYAVSVDPNGKKITVRNNDAKIQFFSFSLGFIGDPNESEYRYDPGGQNQDGGTAA
jgi:hypothetical protein